MSTLTTKRRRRVFYPRVSVTPREAHTMLHLAVLLSPADVARARAYADRTGARLADVLADALTEGLATVPAPTPRA